MVNDFSEVLFKESEIKKKVTELGKILKHDYLDKNPVMICILKGGVVFLSDLIRSMDIPLQLDFFSVSSYGASTKSSGVVKIRKDIDTDVTNRDLIIVEDIIDSGLTLEYIINYLENHNPASIKICALLDKPDAHKTELKIDYLGFKIKNEFVVGYGLDYAEKYRNLPYIAVLKKEIYS